MALVIAVLLALVALTIILASYLLVTITRMC
jgi:hypothetical protein